MKRLILFLFCFLAAATALRAEAVSYPVGRTTVTLTLDTAAPPIARFQNQDRALYFLTLALTQFERYGVGYEQKGISWPAIERLEAIQTTRETPEFTHLTVTALHQTDQPAERPFRLVYSLYISRRLPVVLLKLESLTNLSEQPFRVDGIHFEYEYDAAVVSYFGGLNFAVGDRESNWHGLFLPVPDQPLPNWERTPEIVSITLTPPQSYWLKPQALWPDFGPYFAAVFLEYGGSDRTEVRQQAIELARQFRRQLDPDD